MIGQQSEPIIKSHSTVRFARARFEHYEVIDFLAVLIGYALSNEPSLQAFYDRLTPFAGTFMALFERSRLPHRSTLSRFLGALDQPSVEDNKRIKEVKNPRLVETGYRSPQLTLWTLGPDEWLLFLKLPDYAARKKPQRKPDMIQLPLPDLDENQRQQVSL